MFKGSARLIRPISLLFVLILLQPVIFPAAQPEQLTQCANISVPGTYTLKTDLSSSSVGSPTGSGACLHITASDVRLLLEGHSVSSISIENAKAVSIKGGFVESLLINNSALFLNLSLAHLQAERSNIKGSLQINGVRADKPLVSLEQSNASLHLNVSTISTSHPNAHLFYIERSSAYFYGAVYSVLGSSTIFDVENSNVSFTAFSLYNVFENGISFSAYSSKLDFSNVYVSTSYLTVFDLTNSTLHATDSSFNDLDVLYIKGAANTTIKGKHAYVEVVDSRNVQISTISSGLSIVNSSNIVVNFSYVYSRADIIHSKNVSVVGSHFSHYGSLGIYDSKDIKVLENLFCSSAKPFVEVENSSNVVVNHNFYNGVYELYKSSQLVDKSGDDVADGGPYYPLGKRAIFIRGAYDYSPILARAEGCILYPASGKRARVELTYRYDCQKGTIYAFTRNMGVPLAAKIALVANTPPFTHAEIFASKGIAKFNVSKGAAYSLSAEAVGLDSARITIILPDNCSTNGSHAQPSVSEDRIMIEYLGQLNSTLATPLLNGANLSCEALAKLNLSCNKPLAHMNLSSAQPIVLRALYINGTPYKEEKVIANTPYGRLPLPTNEEGLFLLKPLTGGNYSFSLSHGFLVTAPLLQVPKTAVLYTKFASLSLSKTERVSILAYGQAPSQLFVYKALELKGVKNSSNSANNSKGQRDVLVFNETLRGGIVITLQKGNYTFKAISSKPILEFDVNVENKTKPLFSLSPLFWEIISVLGLAALFVYVRRPRENLCYVIVKKISLPGAAQLLFHDYYGRAIKGGLVKVFKDGEKIAEGWTDEKGSFSFMFKGKGTYSTTLKGWVVKNPIIKRAKE